jgi:uncharacterized protein
VLRARRNRCPARAGRGFAQDDPGENGLTKSAQYWIDKLQLAPHPEGGYFRQTYRSDLIIPPEALPRFSGSRAVSTGIYFLLEGGNFSAFHRLRSDEMWHFYLGSPVVVDRIGPGGDYSSFRLGSDPEGGEVFQAVVGAGCWFASHVADWTSWALVGCTVAPGFDFTDFEIAERTKLIELYPEHRQIIEQLTRNS